MIEMEVLQTATLAVLGFIWTELRSMRKDLQQTREVQSAHEAKIEQLEKAIPYQLQRTK